MTTFLQTENYTQFSVDGISIYKVDVSFLGLTTWSVSQLQISFLPISFHLVPSFEPQLYQGKE